MGPQPLGVRKLHAAVSLNKHNSILASRPQTVVMRHASKFGLLLEKNANWGFTWTLYQHLNKGWPTRWHLLYYLLLNMFQTLIRPSSGACDYLLRCVGWLEACWCYVAGLSPTSTPQVSLHNATSSRKLLKMDVLTSETCWAVDNKASVI